MPQQLMSEQFYQNATDERSDKPARVRGQGMLLSKALLNSVFWIALLGGGGFMVARAAIAVNSPKSYAGHGGHPALNILSFCMNLVSFDWDERVEDRIRRNVGPPDPTYGSLRDVNVSTPVTPLDFDADEIDSQVFDQRP